MADPAGVLQCFVHFRVFLKIHTHVLTTLEHAPCVACAVGGGVGGVARYGVRVDGVLDEEDGKRAQIPFRK